MKIKDIALSAAYVGQRVVKAICVGAHEVWSAVKYIVFKDPNVEAICISNFDTDGDGHIYYSEASTITSLGLIFKGDTEITSFDELKYFSNLKDVGKADVDLSNRDASRIFQDCTSLSSIRLPDSVNEIGGQAFRGCTNLSSINLENIEYLGYGAFQNAKVDLVLNAPKLKEIYTIQAYTSHLCCAFMNTELRGIDDIGEVKYLYGGYEESGSRYGVFSGCKQLEYANIENVEEIFMYAFYNCVNLRRLTFGSIKIINEFAFTGCTSLTEIDIPSTIEAIGWSAFSDCTSLSRVVIRSTTPHGSVESFSNCPVQKIFVPDESVSAYRESSYWMLWANKIKPLSQYVEQ